jgi:undecaprenyl-diphosphatase
MDTSTHASHFRRRLSALWQFLVARFKHGERYGLDFTVAFIAIVGALWIFAEIVDTAVTESRLNALDDVLQRVMQVILQDDLTTVVVFITNLGGTRGTVLGVLAIGIPLLLFRRWWNLFGLLFATGGGGVLIWGLKEFFARARPTETVIHAGGYAFPSGHAFAATVFYGYLIYLAWKHLEQRVLVFIVTLIGLAMITLIGTSRVYLNVHWLTDVLGGYLAGFSWLVISILIVRHVEWPNRARLRKEHETRAQAESVE